MCENHWLQQHNRMRVLHQSFESGTMTGAVITILNGRQNVMFALVETRVTSVIRYPQRPKQTATL